MKRGVCTDDGALVSKATLNERASTVSHYLTQLMDDGLAFLEEHGLWLPWPNYYAAISSGNYSGLSESLGMPESTSARLVISSAGSLSDRDFGINIEGWKPSSEAVDSSWSLVGPILTLRGKEFTLSDSAWSLMELLKGFWGRSEEEHTDRAHMQHWATIRRQAIKAEAHLDHFLSRSVVLTPERLLLKLRKSEVENDRVIEVVPTFEGEPPGWLTSFDQRRDVADVYNILSDDGLIQVVLSPAVKVVLQEIKRMPGRRVAGSRAQAFLVNPFATLGESANDVLDEKQLNEARDAADLNYERFSPAFERERDGKLLRAGLLIESAASDGPLSSEHRWMTLEEITCFVRNSREALRRNFQLIAWDGFDFEVQGQTAQFLDELEALAYELGRSYLLIEYGAVHDLSTYALRIEGIGHEGAYASPYIAKKDDGDGWFPDNIRPVVTVQTAEGKSFAVSLDAPDIVKLERLVEEAREAGETAVAPSWSDAPLSLESANEVVAAFKEVLPQFTSRPEPNGANEPGEKKKLRGKQLVLRQNIATIDYDERREAIALASASPRLPTTLRPEMKLLEHQEAGLGWLQNLYGLRDQYQVKGAVLADDMGLGKTLQLLSLVARIIEETPDVAPALIVAPVSLLENWAEEAAKFFCPGTLPILTAYGNALEGLRVPKAQVDARLRDEDGLVKFLKPGWVGQAKLVLTTYETLRDLEFSFAAEKWSVLICDEAQKIKNPSALVTRAAKKQNASFRIACTGTPVENTLADLWCLFDFIQPGLLGALNEFGTRYRRPIEAKTEEEKARIGELRARIAPQILRRLKSEVAKDLPRKVIVESCRSLPLSHTQRSLYSKAVQLFAQRNEETVNSPFKNHLGLLQYLRLICTDPRPVGQEIFKEEETSQYRIKAPKLGWLIDTLHDIKRAEEKAIIFCEFREIQRLLQFHIQTNLGLRPDIINGDTSAASDHSSSRQKRIRAFQEEPGFGVIILSPVAVGFGVNIQAANHVIHYTRTWNPAKEDQATDRAYRIGQKRDVFVYYPVVRARDFTTFDAKLDRLLDYKRELAKDMLNGAGDVGPGELTGDDIVPPGGAAVLDERIDIDAAASMNWQYLEALACVLWACEGYVCTLTPRQDNGVDVVALKGSKGYLIQVKSSVRSSAKLGWEAIKDVVAGEAFYKRSYPGIEFQKACLSNTTFNPSAEHNAALNNVELVGKAELASKLDKHPVYASDMDRVLYPAWGR